MSSEFQQVLGERPGDLKPEDFSLLAERLRDAELALCEERKRSAKLGESLLDAETGRRLAEERLTRYYEMPLIGVATTGPDRRFLTVNDALCRLFGYSREELIGRDWLDLTHPDDHRPNLSLYRDMLEGRTDSFFFEKRYLSKSGDVIHACLSGKVVRKADGQVDHFMVVVQDVTERAREAVKLRESEQRFRQLADNVDAVFWITEGDGKDVLYVNRAYERLFHRHVRDLLREGSTDWSDSIHSNDRHRVLAHQIKEHTEGRLSTDEYRIVRPDGSIRWVRERGFPIRDEAGKIFRIAGIAEDITEIRQAQDGLERAREELERRVEERTAELERANRALIAEMADREASELKFRTVADTVPGIIVVHRGGRFIYVNDAVELISGYTREELMRMHFWEIAAPEYQELLRARARARMHGDPIPARYEMQVQTKTGERRWLFLSVAILHYEGKPAVLGTGFDITERKHAEAELKRALALADAANQAKSEFLANMSHEIRTPIGAILGFCEMLVQQGETEAERFSYAEGIRRNGRHLLELVNDILDLSKIEAGQLKIERSWISLSEELSALLSTVEAHAQEKRIKIEAKCGTPVPTRIWTDATRLRQILTNIVGNALKFTLHGEVCVTLSFFSAPNGADAGLLVITVSDTGIGISPDRQCELFKPFTQLEHSYSRRFGGTGLGLSLARKYAQALGGDVVLRRSKPGEGSEFEIRVESGPVRHVAKTESLTLRAPRSEMLPAMPERIASLDGRRILLVEDGPDNQLLFKHFLESAGAAVHIATNGKEALQVERKRPFDVILMDIQLPIMDGYEATRRLRERGYAGPIIALTAHAMKEERERCLESGCDDCLTKPIDSSHLIEAVASRLLQAG